MSYPYANFQSSHTTEHNRQAPPGIRARAPLGAVLPSRTNHTSYWPRLSVGVIVIVRSTDRGVGLLEPGHSGLHSASVQAPQGKPNTPKPSKCLSLIETFF